MIFQESGVTFNNVKKIGTKISSFPVGNPDNYEYEENSLSRKDTEHIENKGGFVNAIDIDWDGVEVETISPDCSILILNTTSDLLNWIKCLENRISALEGGGGNVRPIDPDDYRITWNDNGATTAHYGGSDFVYPGETVVLPTTNPIRRYNITWSANGGSGTISGGTTKVTYTFNNWWTAASSGIRVTSSTIPTGDATYYAHWTAPTSITLPTTNPTRSGYTFKGWATTSSATIPNVTSSTIPTGDVTYYAVWLIQSVDPVTEYTVEFIDRGNVLKTITGPTGTQVTKPSNPSRSGYTFKGWNTTQNVGIGGTVITSIGTLNITYYAQWLEVTPVVTQYRVTYHPNGGNSTPATQTVNAGETVTLAGAISRNADSSYTYSFKEWNENSGGTAQGHLANETIPVNDNIDLYAQWNKTAITPVTPTTEYYWYAGQTQPTSMTSNPTVDDSNFTNNKWHTLGNATTIAKTITGGTSGLDWYVAVPTAVGLKATATDLSTFNPTWENINTITINSISYTVWRTNSTGGRQAVYMAK